MIVLAGVATWLVYRDTLHYGFDYDDYHFLRPHSLAEVAATFHGPWDLTGIEAPFYRPLTIALYAARFELFGLNAVAHHAVSLVLFAMAAALSGWLAQRLTHRATAAVALVLVMVCHPAMPYALVAWITNQMHLAQTIVVLLALLWWHAVRARPLAWWLPLLLFGVAAFLIKEDGLMLLPVILLVHFITRKVSEPELPPVPRAFVALSLGTVAGLIALRASALGGLGGYGRPSYHAAWINLSSGLTRVFRLVPATRPWQPMASWFATLLPIVSLIAWPWISRGARVLLLNGVALAVMFNLPFAFVSKPEQMYLVGLGASITLTGAALGLLDVAHAGRTGRTGIAIVVAVLVAGLASFATVARDIMRDFEPFGPIVLAHDDIVRTWSPVPPELRDYVARKREPDARNRVSSNPLDELSAVTFGVYGRERSPDGVQYMWMNTSHAEIQVRANARSAMIPLRHSIEAFGERTRALIEVDGRLADDLALDTPAWRQSTLPLRPDTVPRVSGMHRVKITIDHAWRPSEIIPGSTDERLLGLWIGDAEVK